MRDRGSVFVVTVLAGLAVSGAAMVALVPWFDAMIDRERARTAADAAALAGVTGGRDAATEIAAANGAELVAWTRDGQTVTVTVRVDANRATARATNGP